MTTDTQFSDYAARLREFICRNSPGSALGGQLSADDQEQQFNDLAISLFRLQLAHNPAYGRFCQRHMSKNPTCWHELPAIPAAAFKEVELTSVPAPERAAVFHSSGTTQEKPSRHFHSPASLVVYESSLLPWFRSHLMGHAKKLVLLILTPPPDLAPHSSLAHMFGTVRREFGERESIFAGVVDGAGGWSLELEIIVAALRRICDANQPVALLGTAFNFVHLLDHLAASGLGFRLPAGSRVLETGGYKGRSRSLPKAELHMLITRHLNVPSSHIVCEYGMSELSSQAYDHRIGRVSDSEPPVSSSQSNDLILIPPGNQKPESRIQNPESRSFNFPPWARVQIVSPETGQELSEGETGLIRLFDLANIQSVMAIQTEDLGIRRCNGFELIGRTTQAEARGCSLMTR